MAREITTTGSKKVATLMKEFNENFPYLRIAVCPPEAKALVAKGQAITGVDVEKTLSEVRTKQGTGKISISGNKKVSTVEREFEEVFGLYVQICYTTKDGKRYYTSGSDDSKTLSALNSEKEKAGCLKNQWK